MKMQIRSRKGGYRSAEISCRTRSEEATRISMETRSISLIARESIAIALSRRRFWITYGVFSLVEAARLKAILTVTPPPKTPE